MGRAVTTPQFERRAARRITPDLLNADVSARIRPGHVAHVRNLSSTGLSVETSRRLSPGAVIELTLTVGVDVHTVRARVVRCQVVGLKATDVLFAGGLELEKQLPMPVGADER